jgi:hypothetical protein
MVFNTDRRPWAAPTLLRSSAAIRKLDLPAAWTAPFHQKKPAAVRIASGQINEQTARRRIGSCGSTAQGLERLPHKGLIFQHEERFSDCFRCLTRGAGASQILSGATMAVNSDRSSHRTKPALAVHTSDRSGDLRGRHAQTPAQIPPAGWCDVALRVFHGISENRIATISGGVTGQCREELTQLNELRSISGCLVLMQRKPIVSA